MIDGHDLPKVNAVLNATSAVLLAIAWVLIRRGNRRAHAGFMLAAFTTSSLFLISYLVYHFLVLKGSKHYEGPVRGLYLTILTSHTILAAAVVPLVLITLVRAARERFDRHKRIARWTLPIWMYVSVTGVVVYLMLYH